MNGRPRRERPEDVNEFCLAAFSSIFEAIVIYFQTLVAGDSWGQCMIPIVHHHPWTILFFAAALITVTLGFMNLILAVIVDNATKAREGDQEEPRGMSCPFAACGLRRGGVRRGGCALRAAKAPRAARETGLGSLTAGGRKQKPRPVTVSVS